MDEVQDIEEVSSESSVHFSNQGSEDDVHFSNRGSEDDGGDGDIVEAVDDDDELELDTDEQDDDVSENDDISDAEEDEEDDVFYNYTIDPYFTETIVIPEDEDESDSVWKKARRALISFTSSGALLGRELEHENLKQYLGSSLRSMTGGSIFLFGVPGTGKTETTRRVLKELQQEFGENTFNFVMINGMKLRSPRLAFSYVWMQLFPDTGERRRIAPAKAQKLLEQHFTSPKSPPCIVLLDEIDTLKGSDKFVLYKFYDWSTAPNSKLLVIGISNTMNLPEIVDPKIRSRMGDAKIGFSPYDSDSLYRILRQRIDTYFDTLFSSDSPLQLIAKMEGSGMGDARHALETLQVVLQIAEAEGAEKVTMDHVHKAKDRIRGNPILSLLRDESLHTKVILCAFRMAMRLESESAAVKYVTFYKVYRRYKEMCRRIIKNPVNCTVFTQLLTRLAQKGAITMDFKDRSLRQRLSFSCFDEEDIRIAFQFDNDVRSLL